MQNDIEKPQPLNEDMLIRQAQDLVLDNLNEDVLKSTDESKERIAKVVREAENRKKKAMKESVKIIYSDIAKQTNPNNDKPLQIRQLQLGGHIAEIVLEGKAYKVGTEEFVKMVKGYISELVKTQEKLKRKVFESEEEIKQLKAKMHLIEGRQIPVTTDNNDQTLREIKELKNRLNKIEKHNDER